MADPSDPRRDPERPRLAALLQQAREPLFILNRHRRLVFINRPLEGLLGLDPAQWRGLTCRRRRQAEPDSPEAWGTLLAPPPEVLAGEPARCRRLLPGGGLVRRWCDIDFLPLRGPDDGLAAIVGRVLLLAAPLPPAAARLSESLANLRLRQAQRFAIEQIPNASPVMRKVIRQVRLACQVRTPVWLCGPTGAGKAWLARCIHVHGPTREGSFVALDARRLPAASLADALFGAGAWLERAGSVYLMEPQCLPRELQARMTQRLVDADAPPARVLAGSSADPAAEIQAGRLLDDLYQALSTLVIFLPPLQQRPDDLPLLAERWLGRSGDAESVLASETWELLRRYSWPENLDELRRVLTGALGRAGGQKILPAHLPAYLRQVLALEQVQGRRPPRPLPLDPILEQVERRLIQLALETAQGNKTRAAEQLAIWRPRLLRRMEALGIADPEASRGRTEESHEASGERPPPPP